MTLLFAVLTKNDSFRSYGTFVYLLRAHILNINTCTYTTYRWFSNGRGTLRHFTSGGQIIRDTQYAVRASQFCHRILEMPDTCVVYKCTNRAGITAGVGFYRFPANPQRRELWEKAVARKDWKSKDHSRVCGHHFIHSKLCFKYCS